MSLLTNIDNMIMEKSCCSNVSRLLVIDGCITTYCKACSSYSHSCGISVFYHFLLTCTETLDILFSYKIRIRHPKVINTLFATKMFAHPARYILNSKVSHHQQMLTYSKHCCLQLD